MKLLVVEDEQPTAQALQLLFSSYAYAVDVAADGEVALQMIEAFDYDLILLDVLLPKLDGVSLCQRLRARGLDMPILLLTGQGEGRQKAIALNAGADDYVVKPFDSEELIARVQALLRRGTTSSQPVLTWGDLAIEPDQRRVSYGTQLLLVTPKEYAILELFLRLPQKAVGAKAILDHVWTSVESPGEEAVRVHIKQLRQKLAAVGAPKDFIKTVHGVGYRLNPLYSSTLATQVSQQPTAAQVAELMAVNQELRQALEQARSTQATLQQQYEQLEVSYQAVVQERQQLQNVLNRQGQSPQSDIATHQDLQHSNQHWQELYEQTVDAIVILDQADRVIAANPAACDLLGVAQAQLGHARLTDFAPPEADLVVWRSVLQSEQPSGIRHLHLPDGTVTTRVLVAIAQIALDRHLLFLRPLPPQTACSTD